METDVNTDDCGDGHGDGIRDPPWRDGNGNGDGDDISGDGIVAAGDAGRHDRMRLPASRISAQ